MVTFFILSFVFIEIITFGQDIPENPTTFTVLSEVPYFQGGDDSLKSFITKNIKYPDSALVDSIEGKVFVSFWIDIDGKTIDHEIVKGIRNDLNHEALRIAKLIHFTRPAKQNKTLVKVRYTILVAFELKTKQYKCDNIIYKKR